MVNTKYHGARIVAPTNAPTEEPAARGHGQGKGREISRCRIHGRVEPVVNEIMSFFKGLTGSWMIPPTQAPLNPPAAKNMPKPVGEGGIDALFHPLIGSVMTANEHDILTKFLKLKPPVFFGSEIQDAYEFI
ncbi:hypothetical protein EJD97_014803 [Solanum chilense]|uniref:Uncharacterized protein n=1 Tax=Solanum chilense TaxID=4083 RepID=A0A6N2B920_SOLCI|nr:hypothetical protein EJD97_014803 [Solanum chilense]